MRAIFARPAANLLGFLLINALALVPLLNTGFFFDDILNSQIRGHMMLTDRSLWGVTTFYAMQWMTNEGRLFPLAFHAYSVFYLLGNVLLYKFFVMGVILASIAAFFTFLLRFTRSELIPAIAVLLLPLLFQFRASWDPILAFNAAYPLITLLLFSSLNLFLRAVDEGDRRLIWPAVLLFLCTELIFEVTYPICLVYGGVAYLRLKNVKAAARASWPFFVVTLCLVLASIILRAQATNLSGTYQIHLDVGLIIKTYFVQLFGAVPFSYFFFDPHAVFANQISKWPTTVVQLLPLVVLLAAFTVFALRRRPSGNLDSQNKIDRSDILVIGALLLTIPPALISLSPKFQAQSWGDAYLPVYITYFGLCLLVAVGLEKLYRQLTQHQSNRAWVAARVKVVVPMAFCIWLVLFAFNLRNNWLVAQTMNEAYQSPRVLAEEALDRGLLTGVSPKAVLLVSGMEPWDNAEEYIGQTGIRFSVFPLNVVRDFTPVFLGAGGKCVSAAYQQVCDFADDAPIYTIQIRHLTDGTGAVLLARVQRTIQSSGFIRGLLSNDVTAYFRLPASVQPLAVALSGRSFQNDVGGEIFRVSHDLQVVKDGRGWKLVSLHGKLIFDALSLRGEITVAPTESAILVEKNRDAFELHASGPELLHVGYESGDLGNGIELPAINFENDMCIEVLVVPRDSQSTYATILSNHWADFRGLTIEQIGTQTHQYSAAFGTGKGWMTVGNFTLNPGRRNHISLQVTDRVARLYVNGVAVAHKMLPEPIATSPHPVRIGNWQGEDRPYNGRIEELLIARGAKSEETVTADAKRLARAPESRTPLLLKGNEDVFLHKRFGTEIHKNFFILPSTNPLPETFTLELLVRPASVQTAYATIVSNHPGQKGFQGFAIEQVEKKSNYYRLAFGNGKNWMPVGDFFISPGDIHYLVVTKDKRQVSAYLDGRRIAGTLMGADVATSEYPLMIGNWFNKDRPFNGAIQEMRITRTTVSPKTITDRAGALRQVYAQ